MVVDLDISQIAQRIYDKIHQKGDIEWQSGIVPESQPNQVLLIELVDNSAVTMAFGREDSSWVFESVNLTSGALTENIIKYDGWYTGCWSLHELI
jgi:hypothetical protein